MIQPQARPITLLISSVASPIRQEGQRERTFRIFPSFSRFFLFVPLFPDFLPPFPDFWKIFRCQGGTLPPLTPGGYASASNIVNPSIDSRTIVINDLPSQYQGLSITSQLKPLGMHVILTLKKWNGDFVELGSPLERTYATNPSGSPIQELVMVNDKIKFQFGTKPKQITAIDTWTSVFIIFTSIYIENHVNRAKKLLEFMNIVRKAAREFVGNELAKL